MSDIICEVHQRIVALSFSRRNTQINKDYLEDAQGRKVPVSIIKDIDMQRHDTVLSIMKETFAKRDRLIEFKRGIWIRVQEFLAVSAKDSGARKFGGKKGNCRRQRKTG